jgi:hypothetical protein
LEHELLVRFLVRRALPSGEARLLLCPGRRTIAMQMAVVVSCDKNLTVSLFLRKLPCLSLD